MNNNDVLKILRERRSIRKYQKKQVEPEILQSILEAGTWAASGMGAQPAVMVVIQNPETLAILSKANAEIQGRPGTDPFYGAPTAVAVLADSNRPTWLQDGSLVMGNLMTAAASLGVGSCWINRCMEYFDGADGKVFLKQWGLPDSFRGVGFCILGYADGPAPAPKARKEGYVLFPEKSE